MLFVKGFLKVVKLIEFVEEIWFFVSKFVLCKILKDGDKLGIVYVFEVIVKSEGN